MAVLQGGGDGGLEQGCNGGHGVTYQILKDFRILDEGCERKRSWG